MRSGDVGKKMRFDAGKMGFGIALRFFVKGLSP